METKELNKVLKEKAIELNACYKGISFMDKELTEEELINLWKHFIDFGIEKNFPGTSFIKENFDKDTLHKNAVFVDEPITIHNQNGIVVLNGECSGTIMYDGFGCATIYVRHTSDVTISAKGFAKVFVHAYDNANVNIEQSEMAKVYVYAHNNSTENHVGEIIFRQK